MKDFIAKLLSICGIASFFTWLFCSEAYKLGFWNNPIQSAATSGVLTAFSAIFIIAILKVIFDYLSKRKSEVK